jgi:citrate lyase alpha subunit
MEDNERDRFDCGYDAGTIVDGIVQQDPGTKQYILVDEDGKAFNPQRVLETLVGKRVRMTMVSFEAMENLERMYEAAQAAMGKPD